MKAIITKVEFRKEFESKFGTMHQFEVHYADKKAVYTSKSKDQKHFIVNQEAEFTEEIKTFTNKSGNEVPYTVIKPPQQGFQKQSNFGKALKKEQSKYSGFAVSYSKDLAIAGKIQFEELSPVAWMLFELMVEMDKSIEL